MKNTYRHFINDDKYHIFKNRMVYNAMYCLMHDDRALLRIYKLRYLVCLDNPKLIKMFFGIFDTIETIHLKIETLENNIKNNYLYL